MQGSVTHASKTKRQATCEALFKHVLVTCAVLLSVFQAAFSPTALQGILSHNDSVQGTRQSSGQNLPSAPFTLGLFWPAELSLGPCKCFQYLLCILVPYC